MTAQEVIDYVRGIINSPIEGYITDAEIITWINDGLREFYSSEGVESIWTYDAVSGDLEVPFDPEIIEVVDLYVVDASGNKTDIDESEYKIFGNTIFLENKNTITGTYYVHAFYLPAKITLKTDTVEIPRLFEDAVKKYCLGQAYLKDENFQLYQQQMMLFLNRAGQYRRQNRKRNERNHIIIRKEW